MNIRYKRHPLYRNLKDYIVPILGGILILIILISFFSGGDDNKNKVVTNENPYIINFDNTETEAEIITLSGKKDKIIDKTEFYKGDQVRVKSGSIKFFIDSIATFSLSSAGIFEYKTDGSFLLSSGNLWVESISDLEIDTKFGKIKLVDGSIVNISQYDTALTLYDFTGKSQIENNAGSTTILSKGEELEINIGDATNSEIDLSLKKAEIGDIFKASPWYIKNGGDDLLKDVTNEDTSTGSLFLSNKGTFSSFITFDDVLDEATVSESNIDIKGTYDSNKVFKITINDKEAKLNQEKSEFEFKGISLPSTINDLIVRIFDSENNLIDKNLLTIYNSNVSSNNSGNEDNGSESNGLFKVTTFDIDASQIQFSEPSTTGTFTTTGDEITIRGVTPANTFSKITINDYSLNSFNGTSWKYHAFSRFDNLNIGTNQYKINYFDDKGNVVYTNYFTIIKLDPKAKDTTSSEEVNENLDEKIIE